MNADASDAGEDCRVCQTRAVLERRISNLGNTARNRGRLQVAAGRKRALTNVGDATGDRDTDQRSVEESVASDVGETTKHGSVGQVCGGCKCAAVYVDDTAGNSDTGKDSAKERIDSHFDDRQPGDLVWNC